jgi:uncharacterized protein
MDQTATADIRPDIVEWPTDLDIAEHVRNGWRPLPFRQFVVKVHGRCNLSCDYCYVYEMADQSWRTRPAVMSPAILDQVCARIAEHCTTHRLRRVSVVLHGGEPLLAGTAAASQIATGLARALPATTALELTIQTNGVLLTDRVLAVLDEHGYRVGVSLDGDRTGHDRHRRTAGGAGSHEQVMAGLRRLASDRYRHLFAGLLCTVDLANDPLATYAALVELAPPTVDFLLPHGNWSSPPPGRAPGTPDAPYGAWLARIFDHWYDAPRGTGIRLFDELLQLVLGGWSTSEVVGISPYAAVVIETDGALEQVDTLKSAYPGASRTGLHVSTDPFDAALSHPAVAARQLGVAALADECQGCRVRDVCGGGSYPHRYRAGHGFRNPSVYCPDLLMLIEHIAARVRHDLAALRQANPA